MSKKNVNIKKNSLNSHKITDTNESQITTNSWVLIWKTKIGRLHIMFTSAWHLVHIHVHVANWVFVCRRKCKMRCTPSCFCFKWRTRMRRWYSSNEEKNKMPNPKINYVYESIFLIVKVADVYAWRPWRIHVLSVLKSGASTSSNPQELSRPVMGLFHL